MSSRGQGNALTRATGFLAAGFFATSIALAILAGQERIPGSIIQRAAPPGQGDSAPVVPGQGGGLLPALKERPAPAPPISGAP